MGGSEAGGAESGGMSIDPNLGGGDMLGGTPSNDPLPEMGEQKPESVGAACQQGDQSNTSVILLLLLGLITLSRKQLFHEQMES